MATFAGVPITGSIVYTYPTGKVTKATITPAQTSWVASQSKVSSKEPPFKPGEFLIKPYSVSQTTTHSQPCSIKNTYKRSDGLIIETTWEHEHPRVASVIPVPGMLSAACGDLSGPSQLALQEAYAKLNAARWDALMDLAEIGETFETLVMLLKALASPAKLPKLVLDFAKAELAASRKRVRKGSKAHEYNFGHIKRDAEKGSKAAADAWLTWRYGIMPIILSIQDLLELLEEQLEDAGDKIRTKRRRKAISCETSRKGTVTEAANYEVKGDTTIEAIVYYKRDIEESLRGALGFLPENIPGLAWELVSKSFVWDWFFHLGDWIAAVKPKTGISVLGDSVSIKKISEVAVTSLFRSPQGNMWEAAKPCTFRTETFQRSINVGVALPVFTGVDDVNLVRLIDAVALAIKPILGLANRDKRRKGK